MVDRTATCQSIANRCSGTIHALERAAAYGIGIPASFWLFERIAGF
jgi:hypothetical protein